MQHIPGRLNVEADALSRLVPKPEEPAKLHALEQTNTIKKKPYLKRKIFSMIKQAHNGFNGHGGVQRTMNYLQGPLNLRWKGMR